MVQSYSGAKVLPKPNTAFYQHMQQALEHNRAVTAFIVILMLMLVMITCQQFTIHRLELQLTKLDRADLDARIQSLEKDMTEIGLHLPPDLEKAMHQAQIPH